MLRNDTNVGNGTLAVRRSNRQGERAADPGEIAGVTGAVMSQPRPPGTASLLTSATFRHRYCSSVTPGAMHAIILPTHDRLYTIIGPLKRGMIHICLRPRTKRIPDTGAKPKLSCREDMRG